MDPSVAYWVPVSTDNIIVERCHSPKCHQILYCSAPHCTVLAASWEPHSGVKRLLTDSTVHFVSPTRVILLMFHQRVQENRPSYPPSRVFPNPPCKYVGTSCTIITMMLPKKNPFQTSHCRTRGHRTRQVLFVLVPNVHLSGPIKSLGSDSTMLSFNG